MTPRNWRSAWPRSSHDRAALYRDRWQAPSVARHRQIAAGATPRRSQGAATGHCSNCARIFVPSPTAPPPPVTANHRCLLLADDPEGSRRGTAPLPFPPAFSQQELSHDHSIRSPSPSLSPRPTMCAKRTPPRHRGTCRQHRGARPAAEPAGAPRQGRQVRSRSRRPPPRRAETAGEAEEDRRRFSGACNVLDDEDPAEISLAENEIRAGDASRRPVRGVQGAGR